MISRAVAWLRTRRREVAVGVVCAIGGVAAGYLIHRPETVTLTRVQTVTRWKTRTVKVAATQTTQATRRQATVTRTVRHVRRLPTGEATVTVETLTASGTDATTLATATERTAAAVASGQATATVAREVRTAARPTWSLGALVGGSLSLRPVWGGYVRRRVVGPLWAGAWGLSSGVAGVSLGIEW